MGGSSTHEFSWLCIEQFIIMIVIIEECLEDKEIYRQILITFFFYHYLFYYLLKKKNLFMCVKTLLIYAYIVTNI